MGGGQRGQRVHPNYKVDPTEFRKLISSKKY
jgi:hypothetical protein